MTGAGEVFAGELYHAVAQRMQGYGGEVGTLGGSGDAVFAGIEFDGDIAAGQGEQEGLQAGGTVEVGFVPRGEFECA